ncbi:MAG: SDR family oxidoreductase [Gemmataceae bacterium]
MIPIDLSGKTALVTGVGDSESFAWSISKALQAAGAKLYFASHPRMVGIVENILERDADADARKLPYGAGDLKVEKVLACDVAYDSLDDTPEAIKGDRRWNKHGDFTIKGMMEKLTPLVPGVDILIHSVAFSREIKNRQVDTSRSAYLEAISISSYSLTALARAVAPMMEARGGGSVVGLSYIGGVRVVPHYGGGMSMAKAALECDARQLAGNLGKHNIRVNIISAGPYASRAAKGIGDIQKMIDHAAEHSLMPRPIEAAEVANATAFLCSPLASAITGHVLYVDCGYNTMGV